MSNANMVVTMLVLGLVAGVLSGMFGIGGGLVIVPALIVGFGFGPKVATGTSLFALMWPVGLLGVVEYWKRDELRTVPGSLIAIGLFIGAYFGARITGAISAVTMKQLYGVFLLVVGAYFLFTASRPTPPEAVPKAEPKAVQPRSDPDGGPARVQVQRPPDLS
jgi:uncharacterized protein